MKEISKEDINKHQKDELSDKGHGDWLGGKSKKTGKSPMEELEKLKQELEEEEEDND